DLDVTVVGGEDPRARPALVRLGVVSGAGAQRERGGREEGRGQVSHVHGTKVSLTNTFSMSPRGHFMSLTGHPPDAWIEEYGYGLGPPTGMLVLRYPPTDHPPHFPEARDD